MASLNLGSVDELIAVRRDQHGGEPGAPRVNPDGTREGQAVNRAIIVMMSASLQAYAEDVFFEVSAAKLGLNAAQTADYKDLYGQWGNPSSDNIRKQFRRLGVTDVLSGLSWQKCTTPTIVQKLNSLNQLRNQIAHGRVQLRITGEYYSLSLAKAEALRNFAEVFGDRFEPHVRRLLALPARA